MSMKISCMVMRKWSEGRSRPWPAAHVDDRAKMKNGRNGPAGMIARNRSGRYLVELPLQQ
jgi:hypothetical protein